MTENSYAGNQRRRRKIPKYVYEHLENLQDDNRKAMERMAGLFRCMNSFETTQIQQVSTITKAVHAYENAIVGLFTFRQELLHGPFLESENYWLDFTDPRNPVRMTGVTRPYPRPVHDPRWRRWKRKKWRLRIGTKDETDPPQESSSRGETSTQGVQGSSNRGASTSGPSSETLSEGDETDPEAPMCEDESDYEDSDLEDAAGGLQRGSTNQSRMGDDDDDSETEGSDVEEPAQRPGSTNPSRMSEEESETEGSDVEEPAQSPGYTNPSRMSEDESETEGSDVEEPAESPGSTNPSRMSEDDSETEGSDVDEPAQSRESTNPSRMSEDESEIEDTDIDESAPGPRRVSSNQTTTAQYGSETDGTDDEELASHE